MSDLVGNPEDRFSHNEAHICLIFAKNIDCEYLLEQPDCSKKYAQSILNYLKGNNKKTNAYVKASFTIWRVVLGSLNYMGMLA